MHAVLLSCCVMLCCTIIVTQVSLKRTKTAQQPAKSKTTSVTKKAGRRVLKSVGKEVGSYRPDLKVCLGICGWGRCVDCPGQRGPVIVANTSAAIHTALQFGHSCFLALNRFDLEQPLT